MTYNPFAKQRPLAEDLAIWTDNDEVFGPNCETPQRMNAVRDVLIDIQKRLEALEERVNG